MLLATRQPRISPQVFSMDQCLKEKAVRDRYRPEREKEEGLRLGRDVNDLMHDWLDRTDDLAECRVNLTQCAEDAKFYHHACVETLACADLLGWHRNHGITRYTIEVVREDGDDILVIRRWY